MPAFTDVEGVRLRFLLLDTDSVPDALIEPQLDDAHTVLLAALDPSFVDADPAPDALVMGATLLAGARVLHALASYEAQHQRAQRLGSQVLQPAGRVETMREAARLADDEAWLILAPYLRPRATRPPLNASDSKPVLGGA